jgi:acyl carrier protein
MSAEKIEPLIIRCFTAVLDLRDLPHPSPINRDTVVFGAGGVVDSMGIVMMVTDVEEAVYNAFGKTVSLADDRAMSQRNSPYRSIGSLTDYILAQLNEAD